MKSWKVISSDSWNLAKVKRVQIHFEKVPLQERELGPYSLAHTEGESVVREINCILIKGTIEVVQLGVRQMVSNIFLGPPKDGSFGMILVN